MVNTLTFNQRENLYLVVQLVPVHSFNWYKVQDTIAELHVEQ